MEFITLYPVRCSGCGKPIADKERQIKSLVNNGMSLEEAMSKSGLKKICCRVSFMSPSIHPSPPPQIQLGEPSKTLRTPIQSEPIDPLEQIRNLPVPSARGFRLGSAAPRTELDVKFTGVGKKVVIGGVAAEEVPPLDVSNSNRLDSSTPPVVTRQNPIPPEEEEEILPSLIPPLTLDSKPEEQRESRPRGRPIRPPPVGIVGPPRTFIAR